MSNKQMKALIIIGLMYLLLFSLLIIPFRSKAQDTTRTPIGYTIDYPHVYVLVDTIHNMAQVHNYYHCKMWFSINGGKAILLSRGQVFTVWSNHFTVIVSRKHYRKEYQF